MSTFPIPENDLFVHIHTIMRKAYIVQGLLKHQVSRIMHILLNVYTAIMCHTIEMPHIAISMRGFGEA